MAKKDFYIPKIEVDSSKKKTENQEEMEKKRVKEPFVSPYSGTKVKDVMYFPYVKYGNRGSQYEGLRDKPLIPEEKIIEKYGTKYYEFKQIQGLKEDARLTEIIQEEEITRPPVSDVREDEPEDLKSTLQMMMSMIFMERRFSQETAPKILRNLFPRSEG